MNMFGAATAGVDVGDAGHFFPLPCIKERRKREAIIVHRGYYVRVWWERMLFTRPSRE